MRWSAILASALLLMGCMSVSGPPAEGAASLAGPLREPGSEGRYRLAGADELRPVQIGDDGLRTYIVWAPEQDLPAVFAVSAAGAEEMVDGYMRGNVFTIDRIYRKLVFRIDRKAARAERVAE